MSHTKNVTGERSSSFTARDVLHPQILGVHGGSAPPNFRGKIQHPQIWHPQISDEPPYPAVSQIVHPQFGSADFPWGCKKWTLPKIFCASRRFRMVMQSSQSKISACGAEMHQIRRMHCICETYIKLIQTGMGVLAQ